MSKGRRPRRAQGSGVCRTGAPRPPYQIGTKRLPAPRQRARGGCSGSHNLLLNRRRRTPDGALVRPAGRPGPQAAAAPRRLRRGSAAAAGGGAARAAAPVARHQRRAGGAGTNEGAAAAPRPGGPRLRAGGGPGRRRRGAPRRPGVAAALAGVRARGHAPGPLRARRRAGRARAGPERVPAPAPGRARERGPAAPEEGPGRAAAGEPPAGEGGPDPVLRARLRAARSPRDGPRFADRAARGGARVPVGARRRRAAAPRGPEDAGPGRAETGPLPAGAAGRPEALARGVGGRAGLGL